MELPLESDLIVGLRILRAEARVAIVHAFNSSTWDDPETVGDAIARKAAQASPLAKDTEHPLTDWDLYRIEHYGERGWTLALVAEVRRLRSDEWLKRAAEEIERAEHPLKQMLDILRKHRDGKA
jgi:hypothetical protein